MDNFGWELSRNYNGDDWRNSNISGNIGVDKRSMNRVGVVEKLWISCGKAVDKLWISEGWE